MPSTLTKWISPGLLYFISLLVKTCLALFPMFKLHPCNPLLLVLVKFVHYIGRFAPYLTPVPPLMPTFAVHCHLFGSPLKMIPCGVRYIISIALINFQGMSLPISPYSISPLLLRLIGILLLLECEIIFDLLKLSNSCHSVFVLTYVVWSYLASDSWSLIHCIDNPDSS
jgi:hypothetical protein